MKMLFFGILFFVGGCFFAIAASGAGRPPYNLDLNTFGFMVEWFGMDNLGTVWVCGVVTAILGKVLFVFGCIGIGIDYAEKVAKELKG